jgi:hypothetical protein
MKEGTFFDLNLLWSVTWIYLFEQNKRQADDANEDMSDRRDN